MITKAVFIFLKARNMAKVFNISHPSPSFDKIEFHFQGQQPAAVPWPAVPYGSDGIIVLAGLSLILLTAAANGSLTGRG